MNRPHSALEVSKRGAPGPRPRIKVVEWRRGIFCAVTLLAGCRSTTEPRTGDLLQDLHHADPRFRFESMKLAVDRQRRDLLPEIVAALSDRDDAVRLAAAVALRKLTGEDLDYKSYGTPSEREEAQRRWEAWIAERHQGESPARAEPTPGGPPAEAPPGGPPQGSPVPEGPPQGSPAAPALGEAPAGKDPAAPDVEALGAARP